MDQVWQLKLRYGKMSALFKNNTILANEIVRELTDGFECPKRKAWMAMKTGLLQQENQMIKVIGEQIGFEVSGNIFIR